MTQENKPVPHVHAAIIGEWVKDTTRPVQCRQGDDGQWITCDKPHWHADTQYRFKPRWFDMEQEWIAKGKPPVEYKSFDGTWHEQVPLWCDGSEYRFKEASRHAALKAEWEAKGRPARQCKNDPYLSQWMELYCGCEDWHDAYEYRIKPTPHQSADVLRAVAEDASLIIEYDTGHFGWIGFDMSQLRLRIKP